jgi:adenosine kinase
MPQFLVAGSIAFDILLTYDGSFADGIDPDKLDELSVAYVTQHMARHHGGTAANIAWNFALLNQDIMIAASIGHDGDEYVDRLKQKNINVSLVQRYADHVTPTAIIGTDSDERQITFYHPGADTQTQPPDVGMLKKELSYVLISPHTTVSMVKTALLCQKHGVPYIFDPGQQTLQFPHDSLSRVIRGSSGLICNAYEWSILRDALDWSANDALGYKGLLVVTHSEHGLNVQTQGESMQIAAVPAERLVNPTGAGDALRAGLVTGLGHGWSIRDAARLGATLASYVVEYEGPQIEEFYIGEVYERAEKTYGQALPAL